MTETILVEYTWDQEEHARILAGVLAADGFRVRLRQIEGVNLIRFIFRGVVYENNEFVLLARRLKLRRAKKQLGGGCGGTL